MESSNSSYSPSNDPYSEDNRGHDVSIISTRSRGSQMSVSSHGSALDFSPVITRKNKKPFGLTNKRRQLGSARKKLAIGKVPRSSKSISSLPLLSSQTESTPVVVDPQPETATSNILFNIGTLQSVLNAMAICGKCAMGKLKISSPGLTEGSASFLSMKCNNCDSSEKFWSSGSRLRERLTVGDRIITKRSDLIYSSVLSARLMGVGWAKLHLYHAFLNIPGPVTSRNFGLAQADILVAARVVADESMKFAVEELRLLHKTPSSSQYVTAIGTFDGAYQQRSGKSGGGFSRYCFAAAIIAETGKVVSYGVACNSCSYCVTLKNKLRDSLITLEEYEGRVAIHAPICCAQYSDYSSVHLESAIAPKVISDALVRGIVFSGIVSDGDNKTHDVLLKSDIYNHLDEHRTIDRFECIAHVAKRMKSNLNKRQEKVLKLSRSSKASKSRDLKKQGLSKRAIGKELDPEFRGTLQRTSKGRGTWKCRPAEEIRHLSLAMCAQVASYYRLAVQRNAGDIPAIIRAIKAIPLHLSATDENAEVNHRFCPSSSETWCSYQLAKFHSEGPPSHPNYLGEEATSLIQELFEDFGYDSEDFVSKISEGLSSNHNEAIHSLLFTMVHKTDAVGMDVMELSSALAVIRYNEGFAGIERLCEKLCIEVSPRLENAFSTLDASRSRKNVNIIRDQRRRFLKKQRRGSKTSKQVSNRSDPYSSGKYSGAKSKLQSDLSSDEDMDPIFLAATQTATSSEDHCSVCNGTDANRSVGVGLGIRIIDEQIEWVQCDMCDSWYHLLCLEIDDPEDIAEEWVCPECTETHS